MTVRYLAPVIPDDPEEGTEFTADLRDENGDRIVELLWGDPVHVLDDSTDPVRVRARTREGFLPSGRLTDEGLLEIYVIDVGQGDGVLFRTPDDRWHLVDAGRPNRDQMTGKGAANFIRWKFLEDLGREKVELANVVLSHPDLDHYGGLLDLFRGEVSRPERTFDVEVGAFFHPGLARFTEKPKLGAKIRAEVDPFPQGYHRIRRRGTFITELLDGREDFADPPRRLSPGFRDLADLVATVPDEVRRLTHRKEFLPGYAQGEGEVEVRVLGPILEEPEPGTFGLRRLVNQSVTRNGQSVVLRLDYGDARLLLTGDLNAKSQRLLLSYHPPQEFEVDVAKACHHGSEDVDLGFVGAMAARATVVSSGDNESYSHPRPLVMGASGRYGREGVSAEGERLPPLLYSTELARSVELSYAESVQIERERFWPIRYAVEDTEVEPERGGWHRPLEHMPLSTDLIYGLVNVRTDGEHILFATMKEQGSEFDVKVLRAGDAP